jgi:tetratricopeptide (TPR) repeat protein
MQSHRGQNSLWHLVPYVLLCLCGAISYVTALNGAFQFDDYAVIVNNPAVHQLQQWWDSMPGIRPLLKLSYTVNWITNPDPFGFHLFNLLCHLANGVMVMLIARRWLDGAVWPAFTVAALFLLHPMNTEAVTYISGRSTSLMAFFYLAACLTYIRAPGCISTSRQTYLSAILFLLALATKETAWTLPFALLLWETSHQGRSLRQAIKRLKPFWLVLCVGLLLMASLEMYRYLATFSLQSRSFIDNLLTQLHGQFYLLTQLLWPFTPNIDPDLPKLTHLTMAVFSEGMLLCVLLAYALLRFRQQPWLAFGILWFFLHLLPTNSLLPRLDIANDRQLYLACIGPLISIVYGFNRYIHFPSVKSWLAMATMVLLGIITMLRNMDYQTEISLWQATVQASPQKPRAWLNLGYAYRMAGDNKAAMAAYQQALALDPAYEQARINLRMISQ